MSSNKSVELRTDAKDMLEALAEKYKKSRIFLASEAIKEYYNKRVSDGELPDIIKNNSDFKKEENIILEYTIRKKSSKEKMKFFNILNIILDKAGFFNVAMCEIESIDNNIELKQCIALTKIPRIGTSTPRWESWHSIRMNCHVEFKKIRGLTPDNETQSNVLQKNELNILLQNLETYLKENTFTPDQIKIIRDNSEKTSEHMKIFIDIINNIDKRLYFKVITNGIKMEDITKELKLIEKQRSIKDHKT